jgi:serine protease AprX
MATPFMAGVVALMLDADPTLTPDQIRDILVHTATPMPGYDDYEVGAGYVNAYAAVDKVFNRAKNYGSFLNPTFNVQYSVRDLGTEAFHIDYDPTSNPGPTSPNSKSFTVADGANLLDIMATFTDTADLTGGNTIGMIATAPDGTKYSSGIALPILDASSREIVVKNPQPGNWLLEIRGVRGLATVPGVSLPTTGAALPGPVDGTILQQRFDLAPIADIQGHAAQAQIESALKNRQMDTFNDGTFRPDALVTRGDLASLLAIDTPLRQSLGAGQKYTDLTPELDALAQAVTANGSTLRDYTFAPTGMIYSSSPTGFKADYQVSRTEVAVALVKALGFDAEAKAKAGQPVTVVYQGQTLTLTDNADIPSAYRGYVQYALDRGILQAYFTLEQGPFDFQPTLKARVKPGDPITRAVMAYALDHYRQHFVAGN